MYKIKIFLEDIKAFALLLGALLYVQASLSQTASNTLWGKEQSLEYIVRNIFLLVL